MTILGKLDFLLSNKTVLGSFVDQQFPLAWLLVHIDNMCEKFIIVDAFLHIL